MIADTSHELRVLDRRKAASDSRRDRTLRELGAQREQIAADMHAEQARECEAELLAQIASGQLRVMDLVNGVDLQDLLKDYSRSGSLRASAKKYGLAALQTVVNSLHSVDERSRLVAGKIILDAAGAGDKDTSEETKINVIIQRFSDDTKNAT